MPIQKDELSAFFDRLFDDLHRAWNRSVDDGQMTKQALDRKVIMMDEIGAILRALAEGQAVLTYAPKTPREPAPMIWLPRESGADA